MSIPFPFHSVKNDRQLLHGVSRRTAVQERSDQECTVEDKDGNRRAWPTPTGITSDEVNSIRVGDAAGRLRDFANHHQRTAGRHSKNNPRRRLGGVPAKTAVTVRDDRGLVRTAAFDRRFKPFRTTCVVLPHLDHLTLSDPPSPHRRGESYNGD